jgi:RNA polymerase sigma-70 factor (ECF subfamily)
MPQPTTAGPADGAVPGRAEVLSNELAAQSVAASGTGLAGAGAARGLDEAFDAFYNREFPRLAALAQALCGGAAADDVAQEVMIAAFRRWSEVSAYVSPEAWVRRVCANQATSVLRRRSAEARALLRLSSHPVGTVESELADRHHAFWEEVRRLPRRQAQVTALHYVYDLTVRDVALTLGISEGSVKVHLGRSRAALALRLDMKAEDPS